MAGTLLVAVVIGQVGVPVDPVIKDMMFALFIYATGYVSGPQFFASLNRKTISQLHLALISAISVFVLIFVVAKVMGFDKGTAAGLLAGATTESASIGTAGEAMQRLGLAADKVKTLQANIGVTYAITYLFGMLTVIFFASRVAPRLMGIDLKREAQKLESTLGGSGTKLAPGQYDAFGALRARVYEVTQTEAVGMTVVDLEARFDVRVEQAAHLEKRVDVTPDLTLQTGYRLALQGELGRVRNAGKFVGKETANLSAMGFINEERDVVVTRKELMGKTIAQAREMLDFKHRYGVYATRLRRLDQEIEAFPQTELHSGDVVRLVGAAEDVAKAADEIGYSQIPSKVVDYVYLGLGVLTGILIGMISVSVAGVPVGLGTGGGCLISGLIFGWLRAKHPTFGNLPGSTAQYLRDFGLAVFIASVGLATGPQAIAQIKQYGVTLPIIGFCVALVPCLVMVFYGRLVLKMNPILICGAITGNLTCTPGLNGVID
ncbi:MAG: TrkA C-terminal domain-containing protein, partial [Oceanisphaera sp.]|nr:TrkA C-terminal domain-containing protein [Oceanisphaera sp.]